MKILFLPNFRVARLANESDAVLAANQITSKRSYWFFKFFKDSNVDVIDNKYFIPLRRLWRIPKLGVFQAFKAFVRQDDYDVVVSHSFNSGFAFALLRSLAGMHKPAHVVIDIGCLNGGSSNPIQIALIRFALRSVNGLVYHSSVNEEFYSKFFNHIRRKFIAFGVDVEYFKPQNGGTSGSYAVSIGADKRDYATLIRSWKNIQFPLRIVGPGKLETIEGADIHVEQTVDIKTLRGYIHDSLLVVLPIEDRPYSVGQMTLLQCMSMRKAVVSSNVRGVSDYCRNGVNCLLYESGDAEDLAARIRTLLQDEKKREEIADRARMTAVDEFAEEKMAREIEFFLESAVK